MTAVGENQRAKSVNIVAEPLMRDFNAVAERALRAARDGAKTLVIRNTVAYAVNTQQTLETLAGPDNGGLLFACLDTPTLHHGRFASDDRRLLDREVERQLGKDRNSGGIVVVGTQTLEQSLDLDADLLITDLCPADVLLQRIGRLHRHPRNDRPAGYDTPACVVLTPDGDLSPLLKRGQDANGLGPHGFVYQDLRILEATRRLIDGHPCWRIPQMNRELVECATHPDALEIIAKELGDDWLTHAKSVLGEEIAEGVTAASAIIRRDKSFFTDNRDVQFGPVEERLRTRLGDEGIEVDLAPPLPSPFEATRPIPGMTLPEHLLRGATTEGPVTPSPIDGGFTFRVGEQGFRYDRLGLRREQ